VASAVQRRQKTKGKAVEWGQEAIWNRCHSKGLASPRATIGQLEDTDNILDREAFGKWLKWSIGGPRPFGKRPSRFKRQDEVGATPKGQRPPRATIRQLEGADAIQDREALESGFAVTLEAHNHLESA